MRMLGAVLIVSSVWSAGAQVSIPDISGSWECVDCVRDSLDPALRPAFGDTPLITIEPMLVKVKFDFPAKGRGGMEERSAQLAFALSGEKTNEAVFASGSSRTRTWDVSTAESGRLVVESFEFSGYVPAHKTRRRELFIDQDGQLVVVTTRPSSVYPNSPTPAPVRTFYRRRAQEPRAN